MLEVFEPSQPLGSQEASWAPSTLKYIEVYFKYYFEVFLSILEVFEPSQPLEEPGGVLGPKYFEVLRSILEVLL